MATKYPKCLETSNSRYVRGPLKRISEVVLSSHSLVLITHTSAFSELQSCKCGVW